MGRINEKAHLNKFLDTYGKSIYLLQPVATMYRAKYDGLVRFCNEMTRVVPWRLDDALKDVYESNTPHSILRFVYLCERMMNMFKVELKEQKAKCAI